MFLASLVVIEGLAFIKRPEDVTQQYIHLSTRRGYPLDLTSGPMKLFSRTVFVVAFIFHITLLLWALSDVWLNPSGFMDTALSFHFPERLYLEALLLIRILLFAYIYTLIIFFVIIGIPIDSFG